jgi:Ras-related protein Rab-1A
MTSDAPIVRHYDHLFKILLVGEPGTGKSCLLIRFSDNTFAETYISTIGVDFVSLYIFFLCFASYSLTMSYFVLFSYFQKIKSIELKDKNLKLQMWDTAGQERFRTITSSYYRGAHGIILCFDLSSRGSFDKLEDWLREIARHAAHDIAIVLCGLKVDLVEQRSVSNTEVQAFAAKHKLKYMEASTKEDTGVGEVFMEVSSQILDRQSQSPKVDMKVTPSASIDSDRPPSSPSKCKC